MRNLLSRINFRTIGSIVLVVILIGLALSFLGQFAYFFEQVQEQEIGVRFRQGQIYEVVGPGVYSDVGLFVNLQRVSTQAIPFTVQDEEIITQDKQRLGLVVSGDVFRPTDRDTIRNLWAQYRGIYLEDSLTLQRTSDLARQAMKVCVGDRTFDENIIGTARDDLRACIDSELDEAVGEFGLNVRNLVVPEVILSPEVQTALDAIVQSRLETEKAAQDELRARAQAQATQAENEGQIRIEQSRIQEQTRQQTTLAQLEQARLSAQLAVIEAERVNDLARLEAERQLIESRKENELLAANRDVEINAALADAAAERARAEVAVQAALAALYSANPELVQVQIVQANADALTATDKIIFTQEGTTPTLVLPGPGIVPTVNTAGTAAPTTETATESSP